MSRMKHYEILWINILQRFNKFDSLLKLTHYSSIWHQMLLFFGGKCNVENGILWIVTFSQLAIYSRRVANTLRESKAPASSTTRMVFHP